MSGVFVGVVYDQGEDRGSGASSRRAPSSCAHWPSWVASGELSRVRRREGKEGAD